MQVLLRGHGSEVGKGQRVRVQPLQPVQGPVPGVQVERGRWRGHEDLAGGRLDTGRIADVHDPGLGVVNVVLVGRVTGRVDELERSPRHGERLVPPHTRDAVLGEGLEGAVLGEAVLAYGAFDALEQGLDLLGVRDVLGAFLVDVRVRVRAGAEEAPGRTGVVEVDVRGQDLGDVLGLVTGRLDRVEHMVRGDAWAGLDDGQLVRGVVWEQERRAVLAHLEALRVHHPRRARDLLWGTHQAR